MSTDCKDSITVGKNEFVSGEVQQQIVNVTLSISGPNAMFIDFASLKGVPAGVGQDVVLVKKWGKDEGKGWCMSTDQEDSSGGFGSYLGTPTCWEEIDFYLGGSEGRDLGGETVKTDLVDACLERNSDSLYCLNFATEIPNFKGGFIEILTRNHTQDKMNLKVKGSMPDTKHFVSFACENSVKNVIPCPDMELASNIAIFLTDEDGNGGVMLDLVSLADDLGHDDLSPFQVVIIHNRSRCTAFGGE
jgi:hypothetical protein